MKARYSSLGVLILGAWLVGCDGTSGGVAVQQSTSQPSVIPTQTTTPTPTPTPAPPVAVDDMYAGDGNTPLNVTAAQGVLVNDNPAAPVVSFQTPTTRGGTVSVNADGSFSYVPPLSTSGQDTFSYTIQNADGNSTAQVTITLGSLIWYVNNAFTGTSDGSFERPFKTLADALAIAQPNDVIRIFRGDGTSTGLDSPAALQSGQTLAGMNEPAGAPLLTGPITLAHNVTVSGLNVRGTTTTAIQGVSVSALRLSALNVSQVTGDAFHLNSAPNTLVSNVSVDNVTGSAFALNDCANTSLRNLTVSRAQDGILASNSNTTIVNNLTASHLNQAGLSYSNCTNNTAAANLTLNNSTTRVLGFDNCSGVNVSNASATNSGVTGLSLNSCQGGSLSSLRFNNITHDGFNFNTCSGSWTGSGLNATNVTQSGMIVQNCAANLTFSSLNLENLPDWGLLISSSSGSVSLSSLAARNVTAQRSLEVDTFSGSVRINSASLANAAASDGGVYFHNCSGGSNNAFSGSLNNVTDSVAALQFLSCSGTWSVGGFSTGNSSVPSGLVLANDSGNWTFNSLSLINLSANGVDIQGLQGSFTFNGLTVQSAHGFGWLNHGLSNANFSISNADFSCPDNSAIASFASSGAANLTLSGVTAVNAGINASTPVAAVDLTFGGGNHALSLRNSTLTGGSGAGVRLLESGANVSLLAQNLNISQMAGAGFLTEVRDESILAARFVSNTFLNNLTGHGFVLLLENIGSFTNPVVAALRFTGNNSDVYRMTVDGGIPGTVLKLENFANFVSEGNLGIPVVLPGANGLGTVTTADGTPPIP